MNEETLTAVALSLKKGIGGATCLKLLKTYGSLTEAVKGEKLNVSNEIEEAEKLLKSCEEKEINAIPLSSLEYPSQLKEIAQPPIVLYVKGTLPSRPSVAVIGSRKCSSYGRRTAYKLGRFLAEAEIPVISGLALGIDAQSHKGVVDAKGTAVAVLGSGVDLIYPFSNRNLAEKILQEGGAIVSEFPPGTKPAKEHFPRRNRIISGLSEAVIVVEAKEKSGTNITVNYALEQGKTVFAVPGNIDSPYSAGTNKLIKDGAVPLISFETIFEELPYLKPKENQRKIPEKFTPIYNLLKNGGKTIDQIADSLNLEITQLSLLLIEMEINGLIKRDGSVYFAI
ncbi:DNA processing protein [Desulfurobacterium pacificum]|uniref:DNA processing protein n=1 Tax=Desulfurobacterium pacificum TaxID=240166 RepID=A0ABY1NRW2_9BACT|nr:DNA-processing protein DprA [Desulfurobacterium pacificum]SMP16003.1 DNA processing protein [Desulfurobacterium pacificum]